MAAADVALDERDARALTEYMTVLDDQGRVRGADGLYLVVSESGSEYLVDARTGACECPDHQYRGDHLGPKGCKHARRVAFATAERAVRPDGGAAGADDDGEACEECARLRHACAECYIRDGKAWSLTDNHPLRHP